MASTEFYANASTGANTSAGSTEGSPVATITGGNWVSSTGVFTKAGADLSGVSVGMFAAVMVDGGTVAALVGRITAVDDGADTVTISTTAKSGSLADQTATATLTVGGVWKGPNGAVGFPFGFVTNALMNASSHRLRVNLKNNATYAITAAMTHNTAGLITFQGYTTTAGDGGRAIIDGGTSGASYILLTVGGSGADTNIVDVICQNNGATGNANGIVLAGTRGAMLRVVVNNVLGRGIDCTTAGIQLKECETYACNQSNSSGFGGITCGDYVSLIRCISHDNVGSNSLGFRFYGLNAYLQGCIADTNGKDGFSIDGYGNYKFSGCEAYNNASNGFNLGNGAQSTLYLENCNAVKNGAWGINGSSANARGGHVSNCGFGSGTQANTSGTTTGLDAMVESGSITLPANTTPWVDPANGIFDLALTEVKGAGRGSFTTTAAGYGPTVGHPDIGAAQHQDAGGGTSGGFIIGG